MSDVDVEGEGAYTNIENRKKISQVDQLQIISGIGDTTRTYFAARRLDSISNNVVGVLTATTNNSLMI